MPYIGTSPSNGVRRVHTYTATASQTTFSGASSEGITLSYVDANYLDVFQNGVLLGSADYTSTSGTSVVLAQGASADDLIVIVVYDVFSVADTVSKTNGGSFDSGVTMSSTLDVTGALSAKGGAVFNEDSVDVDFRVESNGNANMLFVDGGNDRIGIGTSSPSEQVNLVGSSGTSKIRFDGDSSNLQNNFIGITGYDDLIIASDEANSASASTIQFRVDASEKVRIHSTGASTFGLIDSSPYVATEGFVVALNNGVKYGILTGCDHIGNREAVAFVNPNGQVGSIRTNGTATSFNTSSDHRIKENVEDMTGAIDRVKQLLPKRFNFIADADTTVDGFLAHEAQSVVAEAVHGTHNEVDDDGNPVMQGIDQSKLVPLLTGALKEAIAKIEALETRITALENAE